MNTATISSCLQLKKNHINLNLGGNSKDRRNQTTLTLSYFADLSWKHVNAIRNCEMK